jgi:hypothetical protein
MEKEERLNVKADMQLQVQRIKMELQGLTVTLRKATPNANGLLLMKDIEKAQRQMDKVLGELGGLVL